MISFLPKIPIFRFRHEDKWHQPRALHSPSSSSIKSFDLQVANWRIESLGRDSDTGSDEEFFDCQGTINKGIVVQFKYSTVVQKEINI